MFNPRYSDGRELDAEYARRRALWEPLDRGAPDQGELRDLAGGVPRRRVRGLRADGDQVQLGALASAARPGSEVWATVRGGLQEGLRQQEKVGVNPFQVGFVGGGR